LRFNEAFEKLVIKWNQDWTRSWNDYTRRFWFTARSDVNNIGDNLSRLFAGSEIYPNLITQLLELRQSLETQKDWEKAGETARIAASLYPQSDTTNTYFAISLVILGRTDEARQSLKKAVAINSKGIASARVSNQVALALAGANKLDAGIEWLRIATEIYSKEAALYGTLGDFYLKQNQREPAINAYKKALELDPKFEHAKEMLKKLM